MLVYDTWTNAFIVKNNLNEDGKTFLKDYRQNLQNKSFQEIRFSVHSVQADSHNTNETNNRL